MNVCRCHLGSTISQQGDRESSSYLPACLSLRHLLSSAVQGRSLNSGLSLCGGFCVADFFRGGFSRIAGGLSWRISEADFAADLSKSCGGFCGGFCSGPKPCKLHVKTAPKIYHKNPPHSSPHARLVCDCTLPAFFAACFAACPSTGILHYVTYMADLFRGRPCAADFCAADFFRDGFLPRRISSAADFFRGFSWPSVITHQT